MPKRRNKVRFSSRRKRRTAGTIEIMHPTVKKSQPNSFFGLPTELRLAIYAHVFNEKPQNNGDMKVLLTCRQIFHEAYASAYRYIILKVKKDTFDDQHSDWLWSLWKLSPYLRTSMRSIQFRNYNDLDTILRAGIFHPDCLFDNNPDRERSTRTIYRVLYDYACKLSSSRISYVLQSSSPTSVGRIHDQTHERLNAGGEWNKKLTSGIMRRFNDIQVGPLTDGSETASFQVIGLRLDGSEFKLTASNNTYWVQ